jgi:hypothetical protein
MCGKRQNNGTGCWNVVLWNGRIRTRVAGRCCGLISVPTIVVFAWKSSEESVPGQDFKFEHTSVISLTIGLWCCGFAKEIFLLGYNPCTPLNVNRRFGRIYHLHLCRKQATRPMVFTVLWPRRPKRPILLLHISEIRRFDLCNYVMIHTLVHKLSLQFVCIWFQNCYKMAFACVIIGCRDGSFKNGYRKPQREIRFLFAALWQSGKCMLFLIFVVEFLCTKNCIRFCGYILNSEIVLIISLQCNQCTQLVKKGFSDIWTHLLPGINTCI